MSVISTRAFQLPLPHEILLIETLIEEDALIILGSGMCEISLGMLFLSTWMVNRPSRSTPLILILGLSGPDTFSACIERAEMMPILKALNFKFLGPEMDPRERMTAMSKGGVYGSTSRTFVIDILSGRLPHANIDGIILFQVHRMISKPNDIFMIQLLREHRTSRGFCKAFTSAPVEMTKIFNHAERTMRALNVQRILFGPRQAPRTTEVLNDENVKPELEQRLLKLSVDGIQVQDTLLELISKGIRDLQRSHPGIIDLNVDNKRSYFRTLDKELSEQIDPIWHRLTHHEKRLFQDVQVFRSALRSLLTLDCVQFWLYLRNLRHGGIDPSWLLTSESDVLFACAKHRVCKISFTQKDIALQLEPHPKLVEVAKCLLKIVTQSTNPLNHDDRQGRDDDVPPSDEPPSDVPISDIPPTDVPATDVPPTDRSLPRALRILIVAESEAMKRQIDESISCGPEHTLLKSLRQTAGMFRRSGDSIAEFEEIQSAYEEFVENSTFQGSEDRIHDILESLGISVQPEIKCIALSNGAPDTLECIILKFLPQAIILAFLDVPCLRQIEMANARILFAHLDLLKRRSKGLIDEQQGSIESEVKEEPAAKRRRISGQQKPKQTNPLINLTDEKLGLSDYSEETLHQLSLACGREMRVFVLGFAESVENEEFTSQLRLEQQAWDQLIHARKSLLIFSHQSDLDALSALTTPEERFRFMLSAGREQALGSSRKAGGGLAMIMQELRKRAAQYHHEQVQQAIELNMPIPPSRNLNLERLTPAELLEMVKPIILVDVREFRSPLPFQLWSAGVRVLPLTLPVADYVLAHEVGVERKSLSDLIQSFSSGRLFRQCERLIRVFKVPILLIEFDSSSRGYLRSLAKAPTVSTMETSKDNVAFQHSRFHIGNTRSSEYTEASGLISRLAVLIMHFPSLRIVWSADCSFSTDVFFILKEGRGQPDSSAVMKATCLEINTKKADLGADLDEIEPIDEIKTSIVQTARLSAQNAHNIAAIDLLQKVPGVTGRSLDRVVRRTRSLRELLLLPENELMDVMGKEEASRLQACFDGVLD